MNGFIPHMIEGMGSRSVECCPASAITPKIGLALVFANGQLAVCSGGKVPEYICMTERAAAIKAGTKIPVIPVDEHIIFAVPAQAAVTTINIGDKVTIHTDGMQVTATKTSGTAKIVGREGTAAGDIQYVRFDGTAAAS